MSVLALSLALLGATVEYQAEFRTVPPEFPREMQSLVQGVLRSRGQEVRLADGSDAALDEGTERLEFEVVGAVTMVRVTLRRIRTAPPSASPEVIQLERDLPWATWRPSLTAWLEELYPSSTAEESSPIVEGPTISPAPRLAESTVPAVTRPTWPLWISGAGLLAMGVGAGFGLKSLLSAAEVEDDTRFDPEGAMVLRRSGDEASVANVLLVSGGLAVAAGLLVYVLEGI